jgi:hypothetical protein
MKFDKDNAFIKACGFTEYAIDKIEYFAHQSDLKSPYGHKDIATHFLRDDQKPKLEMNEDGEILGTDVNVIRVFNWLTEYRHPTKMGMCWPLYNFPFVLASLDEKSFADEYAVGLIQLFDTFGFSRLTLKRFRRVIRACCKSWQSDGSYLLDYLIDHLEEHKCDQNKLFNATEEDNEWETIEVSK